MICRRLGKTIKLKYNKKYKILLANMLNPKTIHKYLVL